jgi:hypothetical protein
MHTTKSGHSGTQSLLWALRVSPYQHHFFLTDATKFLGFWTGSPTAKELLQSLPTNDFCDGFRFTLTNSSRGHPNWSVTPNLLRWEFRVTREARIR